jgi:RNase P/RNase MRP subunit POP5
VLDPLEKRLPRRRKLLSELREVALDEFGYGSDARGASSVVLLWHAEKRTGTVSCSAQ